MKICVLGLGYIGLPTASIFATHGHEVVGVDTNERVVKTLSDGELHVHEPGLKTLFQTAVKSRNLRVARKPEPADVYIIAVPTPLKRVAEISPGWPGGDHRPPESLPSMVRKEADLSYVVAAAESIVPHLRPGNLVVLESTVPPRTTTDVLLPVLERSGLHIRSADPASEVTGLPQGSRIFLVHCPERVLPGRILEELVDNDRVIGGVDRDSAEKAKALYRSFVEGEIVLTDATTAETAKLMENTYRDVNIALANEFALVAERVGINVWEAIELANRHPRVRILKPGPGVGGHCIRIDPWFIVQAAPEMTHLVQSARQVNDGMPRHVLKLVKDVLVDVETPVIACLGVTYKADVDDTRESPALEVLRLLRAEGYEVRACDPYVSALPLGIPLLPLSDALHGADCAIILTDHREFRELMPEALMGMRHPNLLDTRGIVDRRTWNEAGIDCFALGTAKREA